MDIYLEEKDKELYINNQIDSINKMLDDLDHNWPHYNAVKNLLEDAKKEMDKFKKNYNIQGDIVRHERKIEKYNNWVEVYRLANYHFSKYTSNNTSYSEGLFATLLALNNMYIHEENISAVGIIGCGPGRSVLDFSLAYPNSTIYGLDYSLLSLILAKKIVSSNKGGIEIISRDDDIVIDKINGFDRKNCKWGMFDLTKSNLKNKFDIVVCSNVINLMPNHKEAIKKIYDMLKPNGYIIYADLTGWRLDRKLEQQILCNKKAIKETFENFDFKTKLLYWKKKGMRIMKNIILLSGPDKTKYFNEDISKIIKESISTPVNMVVIPADPDNYAKNDKQFNGNESVVGVFKTFKKIFPNLNILLLDNRVSLENGINSLKNADIIYLLGGNPFIQLEYLQKNKFDLIIQNTSALIIGVSAGSMNLATNSYYSKDEDYPESVNEIRANSKNIKIIGLPNNSAIVISNNNVRYIGTVYIFENGSLNN